VRILIDVQTLYTNEKNRGIGIYTYHWIRNLLKQSPMHRIYLYRKSDSGWEFTFCTSQMDFDSRLHDAFKWQEFNMDRFIENKNITHIHFTSPFMFDIELPEVSNTKVKKSYLLFDLIPLAMKDQFYSKWPSKLQKDYDMRCKKLQQADQILTISEASKEDAVKFLSIDSGKIEVVYASTNEELYTSDYTGDEEDLLRSELSIDSPYVYALTGYDARKNNEGMMEAFAALSDPNLTLVISGIKQQNERDELLKVASKLNLEQNQLLFLGHVSEDLLLALYKKCEVFVFPSLYEGFGLPVLEAMRCGVPVITTTSSSLPEVAGQGAVLVDPFDSQALSDQLRILLDSEEEREKLKLRGIEQASKFSWERTAELSLSAFEKELPRSITSSGLAIKPALAFFSPLNPQQSGISDYSEDLIPFLSQYFELTIVTNGFQPAHPALKKYAVLDYSTEPHKLEELPLRLYHMGNNSLHKWIYKALEDYPGHVLLHDFNLSGFFIHSYFLEGDKDELFHQLNYTHREDGKMAADELRDQGIYPDSQRFPLFGKVIDLSTGVFVHSQWLKDQIELYPGYNGSVKVIPHGFIQPPAINKTEVRKKVGINLGTIAIGIFGNIIPNKRIHLILSAFARLQKTHPNTMLYLVGHCTADMRSELNNWIKENGIKKSVLLHESPEIEDFNDFISAVDICINLRFPTMGETSGTLIRAIGYGIPCLVSNLGSYQEYPDDFVWKVDVDYYEEDLLLSYLIELCSNRLLRIRMGNIAIDYVEKNYSYDKASKLIHREITAVK